MKFGTWNIRSGREASERKKSGRAEDVIIHLTNLRIQLAVLTETKKGIEEFQKPIEQQGCVPTAEQNIQKETNL